MNGKIGEWKDDVLLFPLSGGANTSAHGHMPISPGLLPTHVHGMHPHTPVVSQVTHYTYVQNQYTASK